MHPPSMLPPPYRDPGLSLLSLLALKDGSLKEPARPGSVLSSFRATWNKLLHCSEPQSSPLSVGAGLVKIQPANERKTQGTWESFSPEGSFNHGRIAAFLATQPLFQDMIDPQCKISLCLLKILMILWKICTVCLNILGSVQNPTILSNVTQLKS